MERQSGTDFSQYRISSNGEITITNMFSDTNDQSTNPLGTQESLQIFERNPAERPETVDNMDLDDTVNQQPAVRERSPTFSEFPADVWAGTRFTPINSGRVRAQTPPTDQTAVAPPTTPPSAEVYFDREIRRTTRATRVVAREGDLDGVDAWLAPDWPVELLSPLSREMRRGILLRDANNRVARRPSAQAPGGNPIGAGPRDTSPTPAPRRRRTQGLPRQAAPAIPPRPPTRRRVVARARAPSLSMDQLADQLGTSAMTDDNHGEGSGVEGGGRIGTDPSPRRTMSSASNYLDQFADHRTVVAPDQGGAWGRGDDHGNGISTFDSAHGTWNIHGFGTGGHSDNHFEPGWAGYRHAVRSGSYAVPTVAYRPRTTVNRQVAESDSTEVPGGQQYMMEE